MSEISEAPVDAVVEGEMDKRRLALLGMAGVVVLALLAYLLLGQGGDEDLTIGPPIKKRVVPVAAPAATPAAKPPPASRATLGRDPFRALVTEPVAVVAPVGQPPTGQAPSGEAPTGGTPGSTDGLPTTGGSSAEPPPSKQPQSSTYSLRLTRVDGTGNALTARFLLGKSTVQYARVGSRFGRTAEIKLLSLQSDGNGKGTAVIQVGESPFDVRTGDPAIYVQ